MPGTREETPLYLFLYSLSFIPLLLLTLTVHELGHLLAARLLRVRVNGFQIGVGWRIATIHTGRTPDRPLTRYQNTQRWGPDPRPRKPGGGIHPPGPPGPAPRRGHPVPRHPHGPRRPRRPHRPPAQPGAPGTHRKSPGGSPRPPGDGRHGLVPPGPALHGRRLPPRGPDPFHAEHLQHHPLDPTDGDHRRRTRRQHGPDGRRPGHPRRLPGDHRELTPPDRNQGRPGQPGHGSPASWRETTSSR